MTNDNNTPIDTTDVIQTPLNIAATDATVASVGNITASTAAATTSTILPAGNAADETTRRSLFGAGLYQTALKASGKNFKNKGIEINANANVEKFRGKCHYCHKVGHKTVECRKKIKDEKAQANLTSIYFSLTSFILYRLF
ncbi:hypothetical protein DY000_02030179 [Brassica cretica]|uniref:CCHC-type domain-containing protein n=1 Tax=Brassica cretica TaxID=69181 RepID=A0ABQ7DRT5_BRACR|nr:hypothetical protein DY000_02030179 [Brassica cretica]